MLIPYRCIHLCGMHRQANLLFPHISDKTQGTGLGILDAKVIKCVYWLAYSLWFFYSIIETMFTIPSL